MGGGTMLKLKPGQILRDNDPRYHGRKVEVVRVEGSYAGCMCGPRQVKVRLDYIFSDGKAFGLLGRRRGGQLELKAS
jgi:hypothetical protein